MFRHHGRCSVTTDAEESSELINYCSVTTDVLLVAVLLVTVLLVAVLLLTVPQVSSSSSRC